MSTWTNVPDSVLEPGDPIRSVDIIAIKNNIIAVPGGAAGAPRIVDAALGTTVTSAGTNWVLARNAGATHYAVGTYTTVMIPAITGGYAGVTYAAGTNVAGSNLRPTDIPGYGATIDFGGALSGTWKIMSHRVSKSAGGAQNSTIGIALRIA
jgi:hypothetical protein